ncbi:MAG: N-acetylornithine carbamoyltransferase [Promethearchaeota archaeon]
MTNKKIDFISTQDWNKEDLDDILKLAVDIKKNPSKYYHELEGNSLCLFFYNPSTRTRNSFEVGIHQLGGFSVYNDPKTLWLGYNSESIKDTATVLGLYHSAIGIRMFPNVVKWKYRSGNKQIREFAKYAKCPVINLEDDMFHPCQAISDVFTLREKLGKLKNKKFILSWAYHPKALPMSVPNSTILIMTRYGMDVTLVCPPEYVLHEEIIKQASENAEKSGGSFKIENDLEKGYEDAEIVYVKSWGSFKAYGNPKEEKKLRIPYREKWICNSHLMDLTSKNSIFMHCLPVRRNIVVTDDVIDGPHSIVYDQAENRLHVQKALLLKIIQGTLFEQNLDMIL